MDNIKNFNLFSENISVEYYNDFDIKDFPEVISFSEPFDVEYKRTKLIPGGNQISLRYDLESEQPESDNPYKGDIPEIVTIEISITYSDSVIKSYVTINGGNRTWKSFSYENGIIEDIETTDVRISDKTDQDIKHILKKYSNPLKENIMMFDKYSKKN